MAQGKVARAGLVATNSIRGGRNRVVLDRMVRAECAIFDAWSDEPWVIDGAAVRSIADLLRRQGRRVAPMRLNGDEAPLRINADLTTRRRSTLTQAASLGRRT